MTPQKNVIKGYKGSGTQHDPILIENYHDIAGLERAEVGQKGYYFKQTADIDCSALTTWPNIDFCGHYDGGRHQISYNNQNYFLFSRVQSQSTINNLFVSRLSLVNQAFYSQIAACTSMSGSLIGTAANSNITACYAKQHLIANDANECVISRCQSEYPLIGNSANSHINNCITVLNCARAKDRAQHGGIAYELKQSTVENCFVTGQLQYSYYDYQFAGVVDECTLSTIRFCVLGSLERDSRASLSGRIVRYKDETSILQNNIALDSHRGTSDSNGKDGKSISAVLFTQHYFENHLGWDFENTWQWNNAENRPELQSVGVGAVVDGFKSLSSHSNSTTDDLLTQQIRANIWL